MTYLFLHLIMHSLLFLSPDWFTFCHVPSLLYKFTRGKGQCSKRQTILSVLAVHRPFYISIGIYIVHLHTVQALFTVPHSRSHTLLEIFLGAIAEYPSIRFEVLSMFFLSTRLRSEIFKTTKKMRNSKPYHNLILSVFEITYILHNTRFATFYIISLQHFTKYVFMRHFFV